MSVKESLRRSVAGAGVAGILTVGMLAGQAAPAQAILPVVPVVIGAVGGTAAVTAVSGWAIAGVAALNLAAIGAVLAIKDNGATWIQQGVDFFEEILKPEEEKITSPSNTAPNVSSESDNSYVWQSSTLHIDNWTADRYAYGAQPRHRVVVNLSYSGTGTGATAVRSAVVIESLCKRVAGTGGPMGETKSEVTYYKGPTFQQGAGYNKATVNVICLNSDFEMQTTRLRAPTTVEKKDPVKFNLANDTYYSAYMWADQEIFWKAADYIPADPGYRATVECVSSAGVKSTLSLESAYSDDGKVGVPSCAAAGLGDVAASMKIDYIDGTRTITPGIKVIPAPDQYTECDPAFGNICQLEIYIDGIPCVVGVVQCAGWVSQNLANPARVKCFYGTREVSISNCGILEGAYAYGGSPLTANNTDGNPGTWDDPRKVPGWSPQPGPNGEPSADPSPNPNDDPDLNPNVDPTPDPTPDPNPDPNPNPNPGTNPDGFPQTGVNPYNPDFFQCLGSGWSWNPVSWVVIPMQCVLQWAFVPPKLRVDAAIQSIQPRLDSRGIKPFVEPIVAGVSGLGGGGCAGPAIDLSSIHLPTFYPFSACAAPMSTIASGVNSFFALSLVVQGGMSCIRGVASAFGFNWGLGKGEDD